MKALRDSYPTVFWISIDYPSDSCSSPWPVLVLQHLLISGIIVWVTCLSGCRQSERHSRHMLSHGCAVILKVSMIMMMKESGWWAWISALGPLSALGLLTSLLFVFVPAALWGEVAAQASADMGRQEADHVWKKTTEDIQEVFDILEELGSWVHFSLLLQLSWIWDKTTQKSQRQTSPEDR